MMQVRPYQTEAIDAINDHLATRKDNPCVSLPTGSGKSFVMAKMIHGWIDSFPPLKACVLAHRKELVEQNAEELKTIDPWLSVGIYAASLNKRETRQSVTFASIDSIHNKAADFEPFDVLIIDEAHRIPVKGEGKYRRFIDACKALNPNLRVVGLTATPFRMGAGMICHADYILNHLCYSANVGDLIRQGYLSPLRSVRGEADIDLRGVKKGAGDWNLKDLALRVDQEGVVAQAVQHMVTVARKEKRKSIIIFCIDIEHCRHVQEELRKYGIDAPFIIGATANGKRSELVDNFKAGLIRWMLSVDCFFEGFNARGVDCVGMLRPTQSKGLWMQAVGRGLRLSPETGKADCLVLDYGQNIDRHGPIDLEEGEAVRLATCEECENVFARALRICPACGWFIPVKQVDLFEKEEEEEKQRERTLHMAVASTGFLLNEARWVGVDSVSLRLHRKLGSPDSVRVTYHCGLQNISEWVCLDHPGFAGRKARDWSLARNLGPSSVAEVMHNYQWVQDELTRITKRILVRYEGKFLTITDYEFEMAGSEVAG